MLIKYKFISIKIGIIVCDYIIQVLTPLVGSHLLEQLKTNTCNIKLNNNNNLKREKHKNKSTKA